MSIVPPPSDGVMRIARSSLRALALTGLMLAPLRDQPPPTPQFPPPESPWLQLEEPPDPIAEKVVQALPRVAWTPLVRREVRDALRATRGLRDVPKGDCEPLPHGYWPVRVQADGARRVAIAVSQALDPTGELSSGGYWLLQSSDSGAHWGEPLYLNVREYEPYKVSETSGVPLLVGDTVQVEVVLQRVDARSITRPAVRLEYTKPSPPFLLVARLAELAADSDGDGLSDVVESRLLLDPTSPDTDGDGLADSEDPLPHVSRALPVLDVDLGGIAKNAIALLSRGRQKPVIESPNLGELPRLGEASEDGAKFITSGRALFRRRDAPVRLVVLTGAEAAAIRARLGSFDPPTVSFGLRENRREAFLSIESGWESWSYDLEREDGEWMIRQGYGRVI